MEQNYFEEARKIERKIVERKGQIDSLTAQIQSLADENVKDGHLLYDLLLIAAKETRKIVLQNGLECPETYGRTGLFNVAMKTYFQGNLTADLTVSPAGILTHVWYTDHEGRTKYTEHMTDMNGLPDILKTVERKIKIKL